MGSFFNRMTKDFTFLAVHKNMEQETLKEQEADHSCWPIRQSSCQLSGFTLFTLNNGHGTLVLKGGDQGHKQLKKRFFKRPSGLAWP